MNDRDHTVRESVEEWLDIADVGTFAGFADEQPMQDADAFPPDAEMSPDEETEMYNQWVQRQSERPLAAQLEASIARERRRQELRTIVANELADIDAAGGFVEGLVVVSRAAEARRELAAMDTRKVG